MKLFLLLLVFLSQLVFADDSYLIDDSLAMARQGEFLRASNLIVDLANNGDSTAQYVLSMYFRDPNALNIPEVGEMWLMRAAENNNAKAQYDLGWRLAAGWKNDTVEDIVEMIYWFERATFNGSEDAYANLAVDGWMPPQYGYPAESLNEWFKEYENRNTRIKNKDAGGTGFFCFVWTNGGVD